MSALDLNTIAASVFFFLSSLTILGTVIINNRFKAKKAYDKGFLQGFDEGARIYNSSEVQY